MGLAGIPTSVWIGAAIAAIPVILVGCVVIWEIVKPKPARSVRSGDTLFELWVRPFKMPPASDAIIVPTDTNLRMITGITKWVRDTTANSAQSAADARGPLSPGEAAVLPGGRYKYGHSAVAVVMDAERRVQPSWIAASISEAIRLLHSVDAATVILPDFTDELVPQPEVLSAEERREVCKVIAPSLVEGARSAIGTLETVRIWVWNPGVEDIYCDALNLLADEAHGRPCGRLKQT